MTVSGLRLQDLLPGIGLFRGRRTSEIIRKERGGVESRHNEGVLCGEAEKAMSVMLGAECRRCKSRAGLKIVDSIYLSERGSLTFRDEFISWYAISGSPGFNVEQRGEEEESCK
jgi:hypothetical protein